MVGRIWKPGGLEIVYDIGGIPTTVRPDTPRVNWKSIRSQQIGDRKVWVINTTDGKVSIVFDDEGMKYPTAAFSASVNSIEALTDMFLIVMTYTSSPIKPTTRPAG